MIIRLTQKEKKILLQCLTDGRIDTNTLSDELLKALGLEFIHFMSKLCEDGNDASDTIGLQKEDKAAFLQAILKGVLDTSLLSENLTEMGRFDFLELMKRATSKNNVEVIN
jgi:hypothetical protein